MTRDRVSGLRDALGAPAELDEDYYDRSFKQQMEDLGVEVVKPEIEWYEPDLTRKQQGLGDRISVNKNCITLGRDFVEKIGGVDTKISIGVVKDKARNKTVLALRPDNKKGMKITKTEKGSYRIGTPKLVKWLAKSGIRQGVYEIKEARGGYTAYKI